MRTELTNLRNILCPTDLSPRSQRTLGFAAGIAERLGAKLSAVHCTSPPWFARDEGTQQDEVEQITGLIETAANYDDGRRREMRLSTYVMERRSDPAGDILFLADEIPADLIVMKARPSVFSALHYGSIVERVTSAAPCPVMLLPARLFRSEDTPDEINVEQVLFDYDFSQATERLYRTAMSLVAGFDAKLHLISVLEPTGTRSPEMAEFAPSKHVLKSAMLEKLDRIAWSSSGAKVRIPPTVEWGRHADTVLAYAEKNDIDLICTTLPAPHVYLDKLYCGYLGQLLQNATCPIMLMRSV